MNMDQKILFYKIKFIEFCLSGQFHQKLSKNDLLNVLENGGFPLGPNREYNYILSMKTSELTLQHLRYLRYKLEVSMIKNKEDSIVVYI